jgi:arylsulfatase
MDNDKKTKTIRQSKFLSISTQLSGIIISGLVLSAIDFSINNYFNNNIALDNLFNWLITCIKLSFFYILLSAIISISIRFIFKKSNLFTFLISFALIVSFQLSILIKGNFTDSKFVYVVFLLLALAGSIIIYSYNKLIKNVIFGFVIIILYAFLCFNYLYFLKYSQPHKQIQSVNKSPNSNVIWITIDALRADHMSVYGYEKDTTPYLNKFKKEFCIFKNHYSNATCTNISVPSFISSKYPSQLFFEKNRYNLSNKNLTIAEILKKHGYFNISISSQHLTGIRYNYHQGFDIFMDRKKLFIAKDSDISLLWHNSFIGRLIQFLYFDNDLSTLEISKKCLETYSDRKLFIWIYLIAPHAPYQNHNQQKFDLDMTNKKIDGSLKTLSLIKNKKIIPDPQGIKYLISLYDNEILYSDYLLRNLMDFLKSKGLFNNSIIIINSDHGENLNEHNNLFGHCDRPYESQINVPLIMRVPDTNNMLDDTAWSSNIDIVPTILDLINVQYEDAYFEGISLLRKELNPQNNFILAETTEYIACKYNHYKIIISKTALNEIEIFDLSTDPFETKDIYDQSNPEHVHMVRMLLKIANKKKLFRKVDFSEDKREKFLKDLKALGYIE